MTSTIGTDSTPATPTQPTRPREVRLDGKDPCALVPRADWPTFYITKPGMPERDETLNSPDCFYDNAKGVFDITVVTSAGVEMWYSTHWAVQLSETAPVRGFPAISLLGLVNKTACDVVIDVAEGQFLMATVILDPAEVSPVPQRCGYAHQLAESAMNTLLA